MNQNEGLPFHPNPLEPIDNRRKISVVPYSLKHEYFCFRESTARLVDLKIRDVDGDGFVDLLYSYDTGKHWSIRVMKNLREVGEPKFGAPYELAKFDEPVIGFNVLKEKDRRLIVWLQKSGFQYCTVKEQNKKD